MAFHDFWPFNERPLEHGSYFFVLTLLEINKKYQPKYFPINIQYKFGEKKHLRHFCQIFSELEDSTYKFPQLRFSGVK